MHVESDNPDAEPMPASATTPGTVGADAAFVRAAVERFEGPLTLYARHVLGGDAERARDVVQEAFLRLIGQDRAKVGPHLTEWMYTVCRNLAIDVRRKERRMELLNDVDADSAEGVAPEPGARAEHDDVLGQVLKSMGTLPRNQQECIRLKFQGGLSYKQISAVTGLTVTNVGFLIHTGLKTLRKRLGAGDDDKVNREPVAEGRVPAVKRPALPPLARKDP